jgi:hypothetical protein
MKKQIILYAICLILLITNIVAVVYYEGRITDLRSQSTFKLFVNNSNLPNGNESLVDCLQKAMIDYKIDRQDVLVREVDTSLAIAKCS